MRRERRRKQLRVGARCKKYICYGVDNHNGNCKDVPIQGRIVYVHPKGRYYTVEFPMPRGNIRESYWCCFAARVAAE